MKTIRLNIIEAIQYVCRGELVSHRNHEGHIDCKLLPANDVSHLMIVSVPDQDVLVEIGHPSLILSDRWEVTAKPMSYQEACNYSARYGVSCKRAGGQAKVYVDAFGEIQTTTITPFGAVSRTINQKDVNATDWIPT